MNFRLAGGSLRPVLLHYGTDLSASITEKAYIIAYQATHWGRRPPGNKITR